MANLNLPNVREGGDIRFRIGLEDNGVAVDWSGLEGIRVFLYADAQKQVSGECTIEVDAEDNTVLACLYSGDDPQFRGINSVLVRAKYQGEIKVYDKPAINIVARTADADGVLVIDDPVVPVQINVEEVSTSLLNNAIDAAINAAAGAEKAIEDVRDEETAIQEAEAARVLAEQGRVSAEQSRVAQASADHTLAGQDHTRAESDHGTASDDHTLAVSDHGVASGDHTTALGDHSLAESDHTRAEADHGVASSDHTTAQGDHTQAGSDHSTAVADHTQAGADHTVAGQDHTQAGTDHNTAASDHTQAGLDHTQAGEDHTQALADHQVMAGYDDRLDAVEGEVDQLEAEVDELFEGASGDFEITDEAGYVIVKFSDGHIKTKNFDSSDIIKDNSITEDKIGDGAVTVAKIADNAITQDKISDDAVGKDEITDDIPYIDNGSSGDFQVVDSDGNVILQISDGHIKTKNFNSSKIRGNPTSVLYDETLSTVNHPDIVLDNAILSTDGVILTCGATESSALLDRQYGLARRCMRSIVKFTPGSVLKVSSYDSQAGSNEKNFFLVDADNETISYYFNNTLYGTENIPFFDVSHSYVIEYRKHYQNISLKVIDSYSGDSCELVMVCSGNSSGTGATVGMIHDEYKLFADTSGVVNSTITVKRITIVSEIVNPKLIIYGDSISEPEGYYPVDDFDKSWTQLVISQLNGDAVSSGRSGGQIWGVCHRIVNELPYIQAKYVMITIGVNGGLTEENLTELCKYIISQGSSPIINHTPCNDGGTVSQAEVNRIVDAVRVNLGLIGANIDECTSVAGDGITLDPSTMWPNTGKTHPNVEGSKRIASQIRKDLPFLFM